MVKIKRIFQSLLGNEDQYPLEHRILNVSALIGITMSFAASISNYFLDLGIVTVMVPFACGLISIFCYYISLIKKQYHAALYLSLSVLVLVFFPTMYFINAGLLGSIPYYMVIFAGMMAALLSGLVRIVFFSLYVIVVGSLVVIEFIYPNSVVGYSSTSAKYIDISIGFFISMLFNAILFTAVSKKYNNERAKSEKYFNELKKQQREIEAKNRLLNKKNWDLKEAKEEAEDLNRLLFKEKKKLEVLSITDGLTEIFNRRFITNYLEEEINEAREKNKKLTAVLIDIDNFKNFNDTYGHPFGDYVLKKVSKTIANSLRETDMVGRYGGEEFLIVLPDSDLEEGYNIAERIRRNICQLQWPNSIQVTISGGVAELSNDQLLELLKKTDELLYKAKRDGKNRIERALA